MEDVKSLIMDTYKPKSLEEILEIFNIALKMCEGSQLANIIDALLFSVCRVVANDPVNLEFRKKSISDCINYNIDKFIKINEESAKKETHENHSPT